MKATTVRRLQFRRAACALALALAESFARANTIIVDDVGDPSTPGKCTLHDAITAATMNAATQGCASGQAGPTVDEIHFAIPGAGPHTIALVGNLPDIEDVVKIDGYTQPGSSENTLAVGDDAKLMVEIDGAAVCVCLPMFAVYANDTWVRGLVLAHTPNSGVFVASGVSNVVIEGNFIGVDAIGMNVAAFGKALNITGNNTRLGGTTLAERNVIGGGGGTIVLINGTSNRILGNYIGVSADGAQGLRQNADGFPTTAIDASFTSGIEIGGSAAGAGNIVFGTYAGIHLGQSAHDAAIKGNYIGTDATGMVGLGSLYGIYTDNHPADTIIGGSLPGEGNVISGNNIGIYLTDGATGTIVRGNRVGSDPSGTKPVPNTGDGIRVNTASESSIIGGTAPSEGNTIAYNCSSGVSVASGTGWAVLGNSIYSNSGLGITLQNSADPLANDLGDADTGSNNRQNFPKITAAPITAGMVDLAGTLNSEANKTYRFEFFSGIGCHPSGHSGGRHFLGAIDKSTDANGNATFGGGEAAFAVPAGQTVFTATATDPDGNTSEFSTCFGFIDLISRSGFEGGCPAFD